MHVNALLACVSLNVGVGVGVGVNVCTGEHRFARQYLVEAKVASSEEDCQEGRVYAYGGRHHEGHLYTSCARWGEWSRRGWGLANGRRHDWRGHAA